MRKELKYNPLDLQGLEISNAVVNTFPTKTDAQNYFTLKSFGVEQKGMQVIFLDTLKTAKWDGTQFIEGSSDFLFTWEYLVANWSVEPSLNTAIAGGDVYDYTLNGTTRYRFVPTTYDPTQDAFYESFDGTTLTTLITKRG